MSLDINVFWKICQYVPIVTIRDLCLTRKDLFRFFGNEQLWVNLLKRDFGEHFLDGDGGSHKNLYKDLYARGAFLHLYKPEDLAKGISIRKMRCLTMFGKPINIEVHLTRGRISNRSVKRIPFSSNTYCSKHIATETYNGDNEHILPLESRGIILVYD